MNPLKLIKLMLTKIIRKITIINIFVFILSILFLIFLLSLFINPNSIQLNIFFNRLVNFFGDFFNILINISKRDPYSAPFGGSYLPFSYLILYPFSQLDAFYSMTLTQALNSKIGMISVFFFSFFSMGILLFSMKQFLNKYNINKILLIPISCSYVFFFSIERGNLIIICVAFIILFLNYFDSNNKYLRIFAMLSISIATALKVYPLLFGFLYFEKKQYKDIILCSIIALFFIFFPFLFFKDGFGNINKLFNNISNISIVYNIIANFPRFSIQHLFFKYLNSINVYHNNIIYFINYVIYFISAISIFLSTFIKNNKWLKISLITMVIVFLPINSAFYCGLYFIPMIILFFSTLDERPVFINVIILTIFIVFLNPYQYNIYIFNFNLNNYLASNIIFLFLWLYLIINGILIFKKNNTLEEPFIKVKDKIILLLNLIRRNKVIHPILKISVYFLLIILGLLILRKYDSKLVSGDLQDFLIKEDYIKAYTSSELTSDLINVSSNNNILMTTSNNSWILLDNNNINFKYIKLDIDIINKENIKTFIYQFDNNGILKKHLSNINIKSGINYIMIHSISNRDIRINIIENENVSFLINSFELTDKYVPSIKEIVIISSLFIIWCLIWYFLIIELFFRKYIKI